MNVALRPDSGTIDILSICSGGGGLDLGVQLALEGARSVCLVEREAFAVAHLVSAMEQGLLDPAAVWSDAGTFDGRRWRGLVDGLIGGIPCQPHSLAGRKQGRLDERDLWSDARRIIVQSRCWFVLIENVGGMLSAGADEVAGAERVWRDLRKLGFAVEAGLFTASECGAPHQRERVFILGVANAGRDGQQRRSQPDIGPKQPGQQASRWGDAERRDRDVGNAIGGGHNGRSDVQVRRSLGGAAAEGASDIARRVVDNAESRRNERVLANETGSEQPPPGDQRVEQPDEGCGWADDIDAGGSIGVFPPSPGDIQGWRRILEGSPELEPAFRRVADGLASPMDSHRVDRLRMLGNGVVPLQAAYAFRTLATRLADGGSARANELVRMMEAAE